MPSNGIQQELASTSIDGTEWLNSILDAEENTRTQSDQTQKPQIRRVPQKLRKTKGVKRCYEPGVVSIGPYHHGKRNLQKLEEHKLKIAKQFLKHAIDQPMECVKKFRVGIEGVRESYEDLDIDEYFGLWGLGLFFTEAKKLIDEQFVKMMFMDGCFILEFIYCIVTDRVNDLGMKNHLINLVKQDLFLLENQLPYEVLKVLMALTALPEDSGWDILFVAFFHLISFTQQDFFSDCGSFENLEAVHLLDLLRKELLGRKYEKVIRIPADSIDKDDLRRGRMFSNVKELKAAGIHLRHSLTGCLRDIIFRSHFIYGMLRLPRITIDRSTKTMFLNLIALEVSMDNPDEFGFTSYICFLDSLIDHADDVEEMRSAGLLDNFLGDNKEVATLVNDIAADLVPDTKTYKHVNVQIREYCNPGRRTKMASWVAEMLRDHCRSPLTVIAVLAASFAICVSVVQTIFTIFPLPDKCSESICKYLQNNTL